MFDVGKAAKLSHVSKVFKARSKTEPISTLIPHQLSPATFGREQTTKAHKPNYIEV